mmetsp:Transcript_21962/g.39224  ORF Transcript_21962/g.39224 Transcript_21962/m.39224 type:complete len:84 (+) Transcript_21962:975-1226(+)
MQSKFEHVCLEFNSISLISLDFGCLRLFQSNLVFQILRNLHLWYLGERLVSSKLIWALIKHFYLTLAIDLDLSRHCNCVFDVP